MNNCIKQHNQIKWQSANSPINPKKGEIKHLLCCCKGSRKLEHITFKKTEKAKKIMKKVKFILNYKKNWANIKCQNIYYLESNDQCQKKKWIHEAKYLPRRKMKKGKCLFSLVMRDCLHSMDIYGTLSCEIFVPDLQQ